MDRTEVTPALDGLPPSYTPRRRTLGSVGTSAAGAGPPMTSRPSWRARRAKQESYIKASLPRRSTSAPSFRFPPVCPGAWSQVGDGPPRRGPGASVEPEKDGLRHSLHRPGGRSRDWCCTKDSLRDGAHAGRPPRAHPVRGRSSDLRDAARGADARPRRTRPGLDVSEPSGRPSMLWRAAEFTMRSGDANAWAVRRPTEHGASNRATSAAPFRG